MFNIENLIQTGGLLVIGLIVFAESGLLIGFLLPGDTLLFTAGIFAGQHKLPLIWLLVVIIGSAIAGYETGYVIGEKAGPRFFKDKNSLIFSTKYIDRAERFFETHGGKAIVLARFIPIVRTLISVMAGAAKMNRRRYTTYNIIGSVLWGGTMTMLGFWLGNKIPNIERYAIPFAFFAVIFTFSGPIYHLLRQSEVRKAIRQSMFGSKKK